MLVHDYLILCFVPAVFSGAELENAFRHAFDLVWSQEPESYPFRQPVDPKLLGIPVCHSASTILTDTSQYCIFFFSFFLQDYFEIIKRPIDLSTIDRKLTEGSYKDGWEVRERGREGEREGERERERERIYMCTRICTCAYSCVLFKVCFITYFITSLYCSFVRTCG